MADPLTDTLIDIDCEFGNEVDGGTFNAMKPDANLIRKAFICSPKNFNEQSLLTIHNWLFIFLFRFLNRLGCNMDLACQLWDNFLCQKVVDRQFCQTVENNSTGGTVSITLPPQGTWKVLRIWLALPDDGGNSIDTANNITFLFQDSGDNQSTGANAGLLAGGDMISVPINNDTLGQLTVWAQRVDC